MVVQQVLSLGKRSKRPPKSMPDARHGQGQVFVELSDRRGLVIIVERRVAVTCYVPEMYDRAPTMPKPKSKRRFRLAEEPALRGPEDAFAYEVGEVAA